MKMKKEICKTPKERPHMVDMFFQGQKLTGKMSLEVKAYILSLEYRAEKIDKEVKNG